MVEYTARDTLQQNSLVEVAFYTLANKAPAPVHHANLPMEMQYQQFGEIFMIQFPPKMVENWWRYGGELVTK